MEQFHILFSEPTPDRSLNFIIGVLVIFTKVLHFREKDENHGAKSDLCSGCRTVSSFGFLSSSKVVNFNSVSFHIRCKHPGTHRAHIFNNQAKQKYDPHALWNFDSSCNFLPSNLRVLLNQFVGSFLVKIIGCWQKSSSSLFVERTISVFKLTIFAFADPALHSANVNTPITITTAFYDEFPLEQHLLPSETQWQHVC